MKKITYSTQKEVREAMKAIKPSHRSTKEVMERIAELQIARFGLTDTVEEYVQKTSERTAQKLGLS